MILKLNTLFEGYTLMKEFGKSSSYREAYYATNWEGRTVILIIYDMRAYTERFENQTIKEFEILRTLKSDVFPSVIAQGQYNSHGHALKWMAMENNFGETLAERFDNKGTFLERETLKRVYEVLIGLHELSWKLNGGSHNNISLESIRIRTDKEGQEHWVLTDLSCISEKFKDTVPFETSVQPMSCKAPETFMKRYNVQADIFSLGIVLATLMQRKHPWQYFIDKEQGEIMPKEYARIFRFKSPDICLPPDLDTIVMTAIKGKCSERYKNFEVFGKAIAEYLGDETLEIFEKHAPTSSDAETLRHSDIETSFETNLNQPITHIQFERTEGKGFQAVAGMRELKSKLTRNFVDIVQNRELAEEFHVTPPNGMLLWGPPGTGKTYISIRLAEETNMMFCLIQPSDLGNTFIHGSQQMIADLFNKSEEVAKKNKCGVLLVFDEFDSLVPKRGINDNNQANEVAEFLTRLNNCAEKNIFVIATTNRIEAIDPAITRKGRMDEMVYVGLPDEEARRELIEMELQNRPHEPIDINQIVKLTKGYTASDINFIINECARSSFSESINQLDIKRIDQGLIEKIIASTSPSVSEEDNLKYEHTRELYTKGKKQQRPQIGFRT